MHFSPEGLAALERGNPMPSDRSPVTSRGALPRRRRTDSLDSGQRRRHDDLPVVLWPLDTSGSRGSVGRDPWLGIVREALDGRSNGDVSHPGWAEDVVWRVSGDGPVSGDHEGRLGIARYHAQLLEQSGGTFRQRLLSLQGSNGPIVTAHVRSAARRGSATLEMPSLLVFELAHLRIQRVTELPGDQSAWDAFWRVDGPG
jgi:uncharacterized protein